MRSIMSEMAKTMTKQYIFKIENKAGYILSKKVDLYCIVELAFLCVWYSDTSYSYNWKKSPLAMKRKLSTDKHTDQLKEYISISNI